VSFRLALATLAVAAVAVAAPATAGRLDPVIVRGAALAALPDPHTDHLRLYARRDGALRPIPYQFDARDADDTIELAGDAFAVDANDDLVFMAADAGARVSGAPWPPGATAGLELELSDPRDGGRSWAYLLHFAAPPPRAATAPYAVLDADGLHARSALYEVDYAPGRNIFTALRVTPAAGGNGDSLLRQTRMVGEPTLRILLADLRLRFDEQSTIVRVEGVRNGPVRAIRQVHLSVDLGRFFPDLPNGIVHTYHYAGAFDTPSRIDIPWLVLRTLRAFRFENVAVFAPAALPLRYWDGANPAGLDTPDGAATAQAAADHDWWAVSSAAGSILQVIAIPPAWLDWGIARGTVTRPDAAGWSLLHMTRLQRHGTYEVRQLMAIVPHGYRPGAEAEALAMVHQPLQVQVRRLDLTTLTAADGAPP